MRWASLAALVPLAGACTPPEPAAPSTTTVDVTPPQGMEATTATPDPAPAPSPSAPAVPPSESTAGPEPAPRTADEPVQKKPSSEEVRACAARGGKIEPVCMTAHLTCVVRYRDAGKRCTDKSGCQGECLYEGERPPPPNPAGRCQATSDPCGCKAPMLKGQVQPMLCAD